jgi:hypothetical protein
MLLFPLGALGADFGGRTYRQKTRIKKFPGRETT